MQTLQIDKDSAIQAYQKADSNGKELLKSLFGDQILSQKITDRIKTYKDACEVLGIDPHESLPFNFSDHVIAYCKLVIIIKALNEGWTPNWKDESEYKHYPWFYMDKGASGFCLYGVFYLCTYSSVGSRLCFKNSELAEYAVKQFLDLYKTYMTL